MDQTLENPHVPSSWNWIHYETMYSITAAEFSVKSDRTVEMQWFPDVFTRLLLLTSCVILGLIWVYWHHRKPVYKATNTCCHLNNLIFVCVNFLFQVHKNFSCTEVKYYSEVTLPMLNDGGRILTWLFQDLGSLYYNVINSLP